MLVMSVLLATACGGGGSNGAAKAAYLSQAEAICSEANAEKKALKTPLSTTEFAAFAEKAVAIVDHTTSRLAALSPPAGDRAALTSHVFAPLRGQLVVAHAYVAEVQTAARHHDQPALIRLLGNPPTQTKADLRWMAKYGFKDCVKAADTSG